MPLDQASALPEQGWAPQGQASALRGPAWVLREQGSDRREWEQPPVAAVGQLLETVPGWAWGQASAPYQLGWVQQDRVSARQAWELLMW